MLDFLLCCLAILCVSTSGWLVTHATLMVRQQRGSREELRVRELELQYAAGRGPMATLLGQAYGGEYAGTTDQRPDVDEQLVDRHLDAFYGRS